jgi:hypothetical protein
MVNNLSDFNVLWNVFKWTKQEQIPYGNINHKL